MKDLDQKFSPLTVIHARRPPDFLVIVLFQPFLLSFKSEISAAVQPVLSHKHIFCFGSTSLTKTSSFFVGFFFFFQLDLQLLIFKTEKQATLPASCDHMTLSVFFTSFQTARLAARAIIKAKTMQVHMHAQ